MRNGIRMESETPPDSPHPVPGTFEPSRRYGRRYTVHVVGVLALDCCPLRRIS